MLTPRLALLLVLGLSASGWAAEIQVTPATAMLDGNFSRTQLVVTGTNSRDLTLIATYKISRPEVAAVSATGRLLAVGNGQAVVTVTADGVAKDIPVTV